MLRNVSKKVLTAVVLASMTFGSVPVFAATQLPPRMGQEEKMENIKKPEKKSESEMRKIKRNRNRNNKWEENRRSDSNSESSNDGLGKISTKYTRAMERAKRQKNNEDAYNRERKDFKKIKKNKNNTYNKDSKKYEDWKENDNKKSEDWKELKNKNNNMSETHRFPMNGNKTQR